METPTFHKMSHAIAQDRTLTHKRTRRRDSLVIYEGIFIDGLYDQLEWYLWGQGVSVLDHRLPIRTIPAVHCSTQGKTLEKWCINNPEWRIFCSFSDRPSSNTEQKDSGRLLGVRASWSILLSQGMNYSRCETEQLWAVSLQHLVRMRRDGCWVTGILTAPASRNLVFVCLVFSFFSRSFRRNAEQ